jgi:hypothetical protein
MITNFFSKSFGGSTASTSNSIVLEEEIAIADEATEEDLESEVNN